MELWDIRSGSRVNTLPSKGAAYLRESQGPYDNGSESEFTADGATIFVSYIGKHDEWTGTVVWNGPEPREIEISTGWSTTIRDIIWALLRQGISPKQALHPEENQLKWLGYGKGIEAWITAISPKGLLALAAPLRDSNQKYAFKVLDLASRKFVGEWSTEPIGNDPHASFSLDEKAVTYVGDDGIWTLEWQASKPPSCIARLEGKEVSAILSPVPPRAWVAMKKQTGETQSMIFLGQTRLFELPGKRELLPSIPNPQPTDLALSKDGKLLLARYGAGTIRTYDLATGRMTRLLTAFMPNSSLLAFGPSPDLILAARPGGGPVVWHRRGPVIAAQSVIGDIPDALRRPPIIELDAPARALAWSRDGSKVALGGDDGSFSVHLTSQLARPQPWKKMAEVHHLQSGDGWSKTHPPIMQIQRVRSGIRGIAFHPDGEHLLMIAADGTAEVWPIKSKKAEVTWKAHTQRANALALTLSGLGMVTGGQDGVAHWDLKGTGLAHFDTGTHEVCGLSVSTDGTRLAASCLNGVIWVWDLPSGKLRWKAEAHGGWASSVAFSPDGTLLASGGEDGRVCFWSPDQGKRLASGRLHGHALAWSRDGQWLACNGLDRVRVVTADLKYADIDSNRLFLDWADEYT